MNAEAILREPSYVRKGMKRVVADYRFQVLTLQAVWGQFGGRLTHDCWWQDQTRNE